MCELGDKPLEVFYTLRQTVSLLPLRTVAVQLVQTVPEGRPVRGSWRRCPRINRAEPLIAPTEPAAVYGVH